MNSVAKKLYVFTCTLAIIFLPILSHCSFTGHENNCKKYVPTSSIQEEAYVVEDIPIFYATESNDHPSEKKFEIPFSKEDIRYLKLVSFAEAGIDGTDAMQAVMHVIHNRQIVNQDDTILETVSHGFSSVKSNEVYVGGSVIELSDLPYSVEIAYDMFIESLENNTDITVELLKNEAQKLGINDSKYWENGALYFYNPSITSKNELEYRSNIRVQIKIGQQFFYSFWDPIS